MINIENYIGMTGSVDAVEIREKLNLSETDLLLAVEDARRRGYLVIFANNKLYRAKTQREFERALLKEWEFNQKHNITEYR